MTVKAGDQIVHQFPIYDRNGNGCDFDVSPVAAAVLVKNGTDLATAVTLDASGDVDAANGRHTIAFTVPATGLVNGDRLQVRVDAGADGAAGPGFVWEDYVDSLASDVTVADIASGLANSTIQVLGVYFPGGDISIVQGDDYTSAFATSFTLPSTAPDLTGATLAWLLQAGNVTVSVATTCSNPGDSAQVVPFNPSKTDTAALPVDRNGKYQLQAVYTVGTLPRTIAGDRLIVERKLAASA